MTGPRTTTAQPCETPRVGSGSGRTIAGPAPDAEQPAEQADRAPSTSGQRISGCPAVGPPGHGNGGPPGPPRRTTAAASTLPGRVDPLSVDGVDWRRTLAHYLSPDGPVSSWLAELDGRLGEDGAALPIFGSPGWETAAGPIKLRSALRAAEAWRRAGLHVAADIADENDAAAPEAQLDAADTSAEWRRLARWVADNRGAATYDELLARRGVPVRPAVPTW